MKWFNKSQYGNLREYEYSEESKQLKVLCHNVMYCSYTQSTVSNKVNAVDPDGGPCLKVGGKVYYGDHTFLICDIISETNNHKSKKITVILDVTRV